MDKKSLRSAIRLQKKALTPLDICRCSRAVTDKVISSDVFMKAPAIYVYVEQGEEIITHAIMRKAWELGKRVACPKVLGEDMEFFPVSSFDELTPGFRGIFEPDSFEPVHDDKALMIMPGVAFDLHFNRIGYGGGYYDRYLASHSDTHFVKMALCYDFQIVDRIVPEEHDIPVDMLITPKAFFSTGASLG